MTRRGPTYEAIYGADEYGRDVHMNGHVELSRTIAKDA